MKKTTIFLLIIIFGVFLTNQAHAIGIGVIDLTGDYQYEEDTFNYTPGLTAHLLMGYKVSNNLSILLSGKGELSFAR